LLRDFSIRNLFAASQIRGQQPPTKLAYSYLGFAPSYDANQSAAFISGEGKRIASTKLNHNVQEVQDAASYFDGEVFLGKDATEERFKMEANHGRILHLSMHGFIDDQQPAFSALIFSQPDTLQASPQPDDGLLYFHELYNVALNADLAILSACETGGGRYARGEGIMSLGRAFRYAGCENIVMSLWKVNDRSTADIIKLFFDNLSSGVNKDEALRQAKLSFLSMPQNKYFAHPFFWSALVLSGDGEPLKTKSIWDWKYHAAVVIAAMLMLFVVVRRFHRYKNSKADRPT
jgi:CHAT domain-containing protein